MLGFKSLLNSVIVAVYFASVTDASRLGRRDGPNYTGFSHTSSFKTYGAGMSPPSGFASSSLGETSKSFVQKTLAVPAEEVWYQGGATGGLVEHGFLRQQYQGVTFANAVANVAVKGDRVVAFGNSFVNLTDANIAPSKPSVDNQTAISTAEQTLGGKRNDVPLALEYYVKEGGDVALAHVLQVRNKEAGTWFEAFVDAHTGELLSAVDYRAAASFRVVPIEQQDPTGGFKLLVDPEDPKASPFGWQSDGAETTTDTTGNNVFAFLDTDIGATANESAPGVFDFAADLTAEPTSSINAAIVNVFYAANTIHDITYRYGFTSFNFQLSNDDGSKGVAGDPVLAQVQSSAGTNNAQFLSPADGQPGEMSMFLWDLTNPGRDGGLSNDIISHEMMHGVTNRMTGGGTGRCLQTLESGGMGEGWSDIMAMWVEQTDGVIKDFTLGTFVTGGQNIRSRPYSTDPNVNEFTYSSVAQLSEVHEIGEVWAEILFNVYAEMVTANGFSATAKTDPTGKEGNVTFMQLMLDALSLQPCQPTFVTARDAWIQADENRFAGANRCLLFKAFAARGLGANASDDFKDDFSVPADCQ
jgi:extracellular elastinolytic metalloproteinase